METTTIIAIYGALLSTVAIVWNLRAEWSSVKVTATFGLEGRRGERTRTTYAFHAVNKGKKAVLLKCAGIRVEDNGNIQFLEANNLPKKLLQGDDVSFFRYKDQFDKELVGHTPKYAWFRDSTKKEYKSRSVKKLFTIDGSKQPKDDVNQEA